MAAILSRPQCVNGQNKIWTLGTSSNSYMKPHRVTRGKSPYDNIAIRLQKFNKKSTVATEFTPWGYISKEQANLYGVYAMYKFVWNLNSVYLVFSRLYQLPKCSSLLFYCSHKARKYESVFSPVEISLACHMAPYWPPCFIYNSNG